jgi:hypothetical protein
MELLDYHKRRAPETATAKGFSLNAHDNTTFEPLLLFSHKADEKPVHQYATRSQYLKLEAHRRAREEKAFLFADLQVKDFVYAEEFERHFRKKGEKNYLAVIHIDGNTMGMRIQSFVERLERRNTHSLEDSLGQLAALSAEINTTYKRILRETIERVYQTRRKQEGVATIPFRPIICDGDDITVICAAGDAFTFIHTFMDALATCRLRSLESAGLSAALTAGAGIALVKHGFPFSTAYDIAEQLCKNAKRRALDLGYSGENSRSSVDFHVCYSGVTSDIDSFRKRHYTFEETKLHLRPYVFCTEDDRESCPTHNRFDFSQSFVKIQSALSGFPKNKLKGLRNAYSEGLEATKTYAAMIKARHGVERDTAETAELLSQPFIETEMGTRAQFFDVLDVLDFLTPEPAGGQQ